MRINVSGSGVSLGLGPRGANVNISKRGVRQTVGLPGTGLSHQTFMKWDSGQSQNAAAGSSPQAVSTPRTSGRMWRNIAVIGGILAVGFWLFSSNDKAATIGPPSKAQPVATAPIETTAPPVAPTPSNRPLSAEEVKEVQILLKALGFDAGGADGMVGPMTIAAVKRYEPSRGWPASGEVDLRLLESLRSSKASPAFSTKPQSPAPSVPASPPPPVTVVPSEEMRLATRVIREAEHPCGTVAAAVRLSDGSVRAVCSNSEIYRVMQVRGEWLALKCSAAQRMGIQGC